MCSEKIESHTTFLEATDACTKDGDCNFVSDEDCDDYGDYFTCKSTSERDDSSAVPTSCVYRKGKY